MSGHEVQPPCRCEGRALEEMLEFGTQERWHTVSPTKPKRAKSQEPLLSYKGEVGEKRCACLHHSFTRSTLLDLMKPDEAIVSVSASHEACHLCVHSWD